VKVLDAHYHPGCWKCADCGVQISSDNCGQHGGKFYCRSCVGKKSGGGTTSTASSAPKSAYGASSKPAAKAETKSTPSSSSSVPDQSTPGAKFYTYDTLKDPKAVPSDVDTDKKEMYLADDVFLQMFKMDKATFSKLPAWKKKRLKQKVNLH